MTTTITEPGAQAEPTSQDPALTIEQVNRLLFQYDHSADFGVHEFHAALLTALGAVKAEARNAALEEVAVFARSTHFTRGRYEARFGVDGGLLADAARALRTPEPAAAAPAIATEFIPLSRLKVMKQGTGYIVLGTDQIVDARTALPPEVIGWSSSHPGFYVKRRGCWSFRTPDNKPRDARPGVRFDGVRTMPTEPEAEGATE